MSTSESVTRGAEATSAPVAKDAPTEQQAARPGTPKKFEKGQTVCNEKNEKGKLCNGHLKQVSPVGEDARQHLRGDDLLYRCQTCGALYTGPPLGHVRDPNKQARYIEQELAAILQAAGGTLPAFKKNEAGTWVPASEPAPHAALPAGAAAPTAKPATAKPATPDALQPAKSAVAVTTDAPPADETPEQKRARIIAEAKAKAAAKVAAKNDPSNAAPPATAAIADVPAGESVEEKRARIMAEVKAKAAAKMAAAKSGTDAGSIVPGSSAESKTSNAPPQVPTDAPAGETPEQKRARIMAEVKAKAAAKMAAKGGAHSGGETSIAAPPTTAQPPSLTSGTDSSAAADAHRPAAEAQAATGQASAVPLSPAASTASPAAGAETIADLAPEASTELTPGAPADERTQDADPPTA